jgi:hypothetical protein
MKHLLTFLFLFLSASIFAQTASTTVTSNPQAGNSPIVKIEWKLLDANPGTIKIVDPGKANTDITGIPVGVWSAQITVTDANGETNSGIVKITATLNVGPSANAGPDQNLRIKSTPGTTISITKTYESIAKK